MDTDRIKYLKNFTKIIAVGLFDDNFNSIKHLRDRFAKRQKQRTKTEKERSEDVLLDLAPYVLEVDEVHP